GAEEFFSACFPTTLVEGRPTDRLVRMWSLDIVSASAPRSCRAIVAAVSVPSVIHGRRRCSNHSVGDSLNFTKPRDGRTFRYTASWRIRMSASQKLGIAI